MITALILATLTGTLFQETETRYSGPQKGEPLPSLTIFDATGPHKGKETDYVAEFGSAPTLLIFMRKKYWENRQAARLVRELDRAFQARAAFGLRGLVVLLGEDQFDRERYAPAYQDAYDLKLIVGVSLDGAEGPGSYGLNKEVELTILVAKENKVTHNWALVDPNATHAEAIEKAIDSILPLPELSPEQTARELRRLQIEVRRLQMKLEDQQREMENMKKKSAMRMQQKKK